MKLELTDKQLELLTKRFNDYAENGVGNRIAQINEYWNVIEGISVMMEMDFMADASVLLDNKYGLGTNSLSNAIKGKEFL